MKYILIAVAGLMAHFGTCAQGVPDPPRRMISANLGAGKHGTGDLYGLIVGFEYEQAFRPRLSWSTEFAATVHDGEDQLLVKRDNFPQEDMSYRFTTAGMQLAGKIGFHAFRTRIADVGVKLGAGVRYQSSSLADDSELIFPIATGYPVPVRVLRNTQPQRTIAAVGVLQLFARYTLRRNFALGGLLGGQVDTNGDTIIPQFSLTIAKRF